VMNCAEVERRAKEVEGVVIDRHSPSHARHRKSQSMLYSESGFEESNKDISRALTWERSRRTETGRSSRNRAAQGATGIISTGRVVVCARASAISSTSSWG